MKIARVITTWDCNRDCDLCCNKNLPVQPETCSLEDLRDYDQVLLTGGEPMLYPEQLLETIKYLRSWRSDEWQKIYLYTALWTPALKEIVKHVDGIHFTLHHPVGPRDLEGLRHFQRLISKPEYAEKTFRLYIESRVKVRVEITPSLWERVEVKPWLDQCPLPENETLFQLEEK